jgi:hypothetical protein
MGEVVPWAYNQEILYIASVTPRPHLGFNGCIQSRSRSRLSWPIILIPDKIHSRLYTADNSGHGLKESDYFIGEVIMRSRFFYRR